MTSKTGPQWPANTDTETWALLANQALQLETYGTDLAESAAWSATMKALLAEHLDYEAFTERRLDALRDRVRRGKLAQTNLRYKYGFKSRTARLVRRDVKAYLLEPQRNAA
ncbi:MAG: hypothetical protein ABWX92_16275 [Mycetocola sp.]